MADYVLPDLPYDYGALAPHISGEIMELHHDKHHAAYVTNLNKALESAPDLQSKSVEELLRGINSVPEAIKTERLQHYFSTYKLIPGKESNVKVDFVYGREEALKVIAAAERDYQNHYGHLHTQSKS